MLMPKQITHSLSKNSRRCRSERAIRTVSISKPSLELTSLKVSTSVFLGFLIGEQSQRSSSLNFLLSKTSLSCHLPLLIHSTIFFCCDHFRFNFFHFRSFYPSDHSTFCLRLFQLTADLIFVWLTPLLFS